LNKLIGKTEIIINKNKEIWVKSEVLIEDNFRIEWPHSIYLKLFTAAF